jgi:hypothetical protein
VAGAIFYREKQQKQPSLNWKTMQRDKMGCFYKKLN